MGQRSSSESVVRIFQAFLGTRVWQQAELARHVGIKVPALHRILAELREAGMPLHSEEEHPHVYWSVPKEWFPGGMAFPKDSLPDLLQAIFSLPQGGTRQRLLARVREILPNQPGLAETASSIITHEPSESEERFMPFIQAALSNKQVLRLQYFTASRGDTTLRAVSVQRVINEPRRRLVAYCHRSLGLRWFRVDNIWKAKLDEQTPFHRVAPKDVQRFLAESVDGFHTGKADEELSFLVRYPEARWVRNNLLSTMRVDDDDSPKDRLRIVCGSAGAIVVARFVAGLGDVATAEGTALRKLVKEIAKGALKNSENSGSASATTPSKTEHSRSRLHSTEQMEP